MKHTYMLLLAALVLLAGCSTGVPEALDPSTLASGDAEVEYFSSEAELSSFLSSQGSNSYAYGAPMMARASMDGDMAIEESAQNSAGGEGFSGTNNQEAGVDEPDIFKTDGEYIYTASGRTLFITSTGEDAELLSRTNLEMNVQGLFIQGDNLVVIGNEWARLGDFAARSSIWYPGGSSSMIVRVYDVSNAEEPEQVKEVEYEGYYVDARLKNDVAYVISNSGVSHEQPIPLMKVDGVETSMPVDRIAYFPGVYDNPQLTTVHTIDLASLSVASDAVLTESTHTIYMDEHLYLSSTEYVNEYEIRQDKVIELAQKYLTNDDEELIERIEDTDSDILSRAEKDQKIRQVVMKRLSELDSDEQERFQNNVDTAVKQELDQYEYREYTTIAKFAVDQDGIDAVATGKVAGRVYDSFGFDEANALRVVTTTSGIWENGKMTRESENHLFTLDGDLEEIDSIHGIAEGESIFSARYTDERLYLVTFEQVDPFFVIDVSDSSDLEILGELKITGFSRYLHPISEDVVLGLGREASETGRQQGLKISLFDVSDVENPEEITKWVSEDRSSSSAAEWEHKAILIDREKELMVIPVSSWEEDNRYQGAFVFSLTKDDIELRGLIEHDQSVERSAWIGTELYTKSYDLLRVNSLDDLEGLADIELKQVSNTDVPVY